MIIGKILRSQNKEKYPVICLLYSKFKQLLKSSSIYIAQNFPFKSPGLTGHFPTAIWISNHYISILPSMETATVC